MPWEDPTLTESEDDHSEDDSSDNNVSTAYNYISNGVEEGAPYEPDDVSVSAAEDNV